MKKMLSELILEGAKLRPQGFDDYFSESEDGTICSCAMGAFFEATGRNPVPEMLAPFELSRQLPENLGKKIVKWNDKDRLSRNAIAQKLIDEGLDVEITF